MNVTARKLLLTFVAVSASSFSAQASETNLNSIVVPKNDGKLARYLLLPVHHRAEHAAVVNARLSKAALDSALPKSYQIPVSMIPPVRDQGQRGTCAYFATVGVMESYYIRQNPSIQSSLKISEECLVDHRNWEVDQASAYTGDDKPDERPDPNGDLPQSIVKTVTEKGVPFAQSYSNGVSCVYDGMNQTGGAVSESDYLATFSDSTAYGKGLTFNVNMAPTYDTVKALLAQNIPVEVGIVVYNDFMYGGSDWRYNAKTDTSDNIAGGHAIMLVGYTVQDGKTIFTFKNSWGDSWGNSGFGTIDDGILKDSWAYDPGFDVSVSL